MIFVIGVGCLVRLLPWLNVWWEGDDGGWCIMVNHFNHLKITVQTSPHSPFTLILSHSGERILDAAHQSSAAAWRAVDFSPRLFACSGVKLAKMYQNMPVWTCARVEGGAL